MASNGTSANALEKRQAARFILVLIDDFCPASRPGAVHQRQRELKSEEEEKLRDENDMIEKD
jgi:hypothetical protein